MLTQILIGSVLMVLTVIIHAIGTSVGLRWLDTARARPGYLTTVVQRSLVVGMLVIIMFVATLLEAALWAGTYKLFYAVAGFEKALYFSIVTYTTLGYGDIVLDENWRLLSSFQAANGIMIFGWTTAVIIVAMKAISRRLSEFDEIR